MILTAFTAQRWQALFVDIDGAPAPQTVNDRNLTLNNMNDAISVKQVQGVIAFERRDSPFTLLKKLPLGPEGEIFLDEIHIG